MANVEPRCHGDVWSTPPRQDPFRIGPCLAVDRNAEDNVVVRQVNGLVDDGRVLERWNPVDPHPAPFDLVEADPQRHSPPEELRESPVDLTVPLPVEVPVVQMGIVRLTPNPLVSLRKVWPKPLAGLLTERSDQREEANEVVPRWTREKGESSDDTCIAIPPFRPDLLKRQVSPPAPVLFAYWLPLSRCSSSTVP